jgi:hypothetical protein
MNYTIEIKYSTTDSNNYELLDDVVMIIKRMLPHMADNVQVKWTSNGADWFQADSVQYKEH